MGKGIFLLVLFLFGNIFFVNGLFPSDEGGMNECPPGQVDVGPGFGGGCNPEKYVWEGTPWFVWLLLGMIFFLLVIILIYYFKKRK